MNAGFVKLPRSIKESRSYNKSALHRAMILTLYEMTNWKKSTFAGVELEENQFSTSISALAHELQASRTTVARVLTDLATDNLFSSRNMGNRWTLVTVEKSAIYDDSQITTGYPESNRMVDSRITTGRPESTEEEYKNKEEKNTTPIPFGDCPLQGAVPPAAEREPEPEPLPWEGAPLQKEPEAKPEPKPAKRRTKAEKQTLTKRPDYTPEFEELWHWYPNKTNKQGAFNTYLTYLEAGELPEHGDFLHRIKMRRHEPDWEKDEGKYVPHMQTWLNRRGWEDGGCFDPDAKPQKFLSPEKLAVRQEIIDYYQEKIDTSIMPLEAQLWRERMEDDLEIEGVAPWQWSN